MNRELGVNREVSTAPPPPGIVVYGGGGHGKVLIELLRALGTYSLVGVVDDRLPVGSGLLGVAVLGDSETLGDLVAGGVNLAVNGVGGIGDPAARVAASARLEAAGLACTAVVHPTAVVEGSASLADGVQVLALAYVGSESRIGRGTLLNTGASVNHDCRLGDHVNLSPGALLAGDVEIGDRSQIGMGATVNVGVRIGRDARVGNSAVVKGDVADGARVRAGHTWPEG